MTRRTTALLAASLLTFALGACGDDDSATTAAPGTTAGSEGGSTLVIQGFEFAEVPDVAVGEEVVVENRDGATHTWTATDGTFDSGNISGGSSFTFTFDEAGTYDFFCAIHASMTGSITVTG